MWIIDTIKLSVMYLGAILLALFVSAELSSFTGISIDYFIVTFGLIAFGVVRVKDRQHKKNIQED
jgi:hypothetical protein